MGNSQDRSRRSEIWPALPLDEWKETLDTLHMWMQIVGKVKLELSPFLNEWWEVAFSISSRGLTTSTIPIDHEIFQADFDFIDHNLTVSTSTGAVKAMPLAPRSVADFYREFMLMLEQLGIEVQINPKPVEVENDIPLNQDQVHAAYDAEDAHRCWRIMVQVERILERYRSPFVGKSSPIQFFWGTFDLVETRFSGRPAPEREWPTRIGRYGGDQEAASAGYWPGSAKLDGPGFFAFTCPAPDGYASASVRPEAAYYDSDYGEFLLSYEDVRMSPNPDQAILDFFQSTYEAGANLAHWDRATLERQDFPRLGASNES